MKTGATLVNYFPVIVAKMPQDVGKAVEKGAEMIADAARSKAPVGTSGLRGTPNIRESIEVREVSSEELGKRQVTAAKRGNTLGISPGMANQMTAYTVEAQARSPKQVKSGGIPYALMVEFGTERGAKGPNTRRPFMVPAFEEKRQEVIDMVSDELGEII